MAYGIHVTLSIISPRTCITIANGTALYSVRLRHAHTCHAGCTTLAEALTACNEACTSLQSPGLHHLKTTTGTETVCGHVSDIAAAVIPGIQSTTQVHHCSGAAIATSNSQKLGVLAACHIEDVVCMLIARVWHNRETDTVSQCAAHTGVDLAGLLSMPKSKRGTSGPTVL